MAGKKIGGSTAKSTTKKAAATDGKVAVNADKEKYVTTKAASGSKSLHNNDEVALALDGLELSEVQAIADATIGENDFRTRYANLNPGMQRMNIGNRIRGWLHKDDKNGATLKKAAAPHRKAAAERLKSKAGKAKPKAA